MFGSLGLIGLAVLGAPLFLVISASALLGFASIGRPAADVTGDVTKLLQMDLITIPLFTFAGYLLAESGAPRRLVAVTRALFGWAPGGMAVVTLITCAFFTTFTGASGITIVALGGLLLPMLLQQGYDRNFSLGLISSSGSRGLVFPPSLPVIIYGYVGMVDITKLYIAGIVPGLIDVGIVAFFCVRAGLIAKVPRTKFEPREAAKAVFKALPEVLLPVWLVALILTGVLKVPEAAAMTALYVLIVEVVIYRDVHPIKDLPRITKESMVLCGAILIILGASMGMTNFLVQKGIPQMIVETMSNVIPNKWVFLLALNVFLLIVGCMMDIFSAIVVVVPLLTPLAGEFGVHPIHLAIIFLINLELGYNTPPVGMNLFIASFRFRQPVMRLYRAVLPFVLLALVALAVITYVEPVSTFTVTKSQPTAKAGGGSGSGSGNAGAGAASGTGSGTGKPAKKKNLLDGLCPDPSNKADPDCDDIDADDDLDDDDDDKKKKGSGKGSGSGSGSASGSGSGSGTAAGSGSGTAAGSGTSATGTGTGTGTGAGSAAAGKGTGTGATK